MILNNLHRDWKN